MSGYIDPFERDVEPNDPREPERPRFGPGREAQDLVTILDEIDDDGVSAS